MSVTFEEDHVLFTFDKLSSKLDLDETSTKKRLTRPPFKLVHYLIQSLCIDTPFGSMLFTDEEKDIRLLQSKEAKLDFLIKMISLVKFASPGIKVTLNPVAVLAGKIII